MKDDGNTATRALRACVEIQRHPEGDESEVAFFVYSPDGTPLTGNQIIEAIAEALLLHWDNMPMENPGPLEYDA